MAVWAIAHNVFCSDCHSGFKTIRGCEEDRANPLVVEGYETFRCPASFMTGAVEAYLHAYGYYKSGFLPEGGGWLDQPVKVGSAIMIIDRLMQTFEKEKNHGNDK